MAAEEQGFDEREELSEDDTVVLETPDGQQLTCVLLAVVEHEGRTYAVLTRQEEDDDDELLLTRYDEDAAGAARFSPLDDDSVVAALQEVVGGLFGEG